MGRLVKGRLAVVVDGRLIGALRNGSQRLDDSNVYLLHVVVDGWDAMALSDRATAARIIFVGHDCFDDCHCVDREMFDARTTMTWTGTRNDKVTPTACQAHEGCRESYAIAEDCVLSRMPGRLPKDG